MLSQNLKHLGYQTYKELYASLPYVTLCSKDFAEKHDQHIFIIYEFIMLCQDLAKIVEDSCLWMDFTLKLTKRLVFPDRNQTLLYLNMLVDKSHAYIKDDHDNRPFYQFINFVYKMMWEVLTYIE